MRLQCCHVLDPSSTLHIVITTWRSARVGKVTSTVAHAFSVLFDASGWIVIGLARLVLCFVITTACRNGGVVQSGLGLTLGFVLRFQLPTREHTYSTTHETLPTLPPCTGPFCGVQRGPFLFRGLLEPDPSRTKCELLGRRPAP